MRHLLFCVLLLPGLAAAEIYRWTDAQGRVHFGERPPAGAEQIEVKPQVVERDDATRERETRAAKVFDARRQEQAQAASEAAEQRARRDTECRRLRSDLAQIERGGRYFTETAQGERVYYSDDEIATARRRLQAQITERCG